MIKEIYKKEKISYPIDELSPHLFWDIEKSKIDFEKNQKWIIGRVLEYGLLNDWKIIQSYYSIQQIAHIAIQLKNLDEKSMAFISMLSKIPKEEFACYTFEQSNPKHWNF